jgi:hypothetical protein
MKPLTPINAGLKAMKFSLIFISLLVLASSCMKNKIDKDDLRDFQQVNLVANNVYSPVLTDPTLQNAWGLAWSPGGIAWVNSQAGHVSELYTGEGAMLRPGVNIPSPTDTIGGAPTELYLPGAQDLCWRMAAGGFSLWVMTESFPAGMGREIMRSGSPIIRLLQLIPVWRLIPGMVHIYSMQPI